MKLLLDTHVFLWYISKDSRLPNAMLENIRNPDNEVFLSVVSVWETIIKYQIGKLPLPQSPEIYLPTQRKRHSISSLILDESSVCHLSKLPSIHRDPFDRILICQAIEHGLTIATIDNAIKSYAVNILK
ncbi:PIN domain-containing protein [Desulfonema limicola]|uniref:PIN domain-containing protein n=1 Tax=Desulfonema limicola TaxID=45656 RepID=A0A975BDN1_9BACT|nr:type II toxin-antitoxin system VapC family toxin [Desulfonema limicola]QTA83521.1 PIN domain-containing protein [Desulfonema limicola]